MNTAARRPPSSAAIPNGTKFRSILADGNPEWTVVLRVGRADVSMAKILEVSADGFGTVKSFTGDEIRRTKGMDAALSAASNGSDAFYARLTPGSAVHYHASFGQYIRCAVVRQTDGNKLVPLALVGAWGTNDLPKRNQDGTITPGYHANSIAKGEPWRPHYTCVFESGSAGAKYGDIDPRVLPAIDLTLPAMTPEQERLAALEIAMKAVCEMFGRRPIGDASALATAQAKLITAQSLIADALKVDDDAAALRMAATK